MANNRLYLVHPPSGVYVMIAKHFGTGWTTPNEVGHFLDIFFQSVEELSGDIKCQENIIAADEQYMHKKGLLP